MNQSSFQSKMSPYSKSEFIPNNLIQDVLSNYFPGNKIFHSFNNDYTHLLIKIKINELLSAPVVNWSLNRPPDMFRCRDIAKSVYELKMPIDSMIYLSFNNLNQTFEVLDGIHRITALRIIRKENSAQLNLVVPNDFGHDNDAEQWLFDSYIMVNIRFNTNIGVLIQTFQNLNKSNPVPELYINDNSKEKKQIIEDIVKQYQRLFKGHFSTSQNPTIPNINREKFIDILDKVYEKYNITTETKHRIDEQLTQANTFIQNNIPAKATKKALEKCTESGCYLFLLKEDKLLEII
jgi:hypothetical protein